MKKSVGDISIVRARAGQETTSEALAVEGGKGTEKVIPDDRDALVSKQ